MHPISQIKKQGKYMLNTTQGTSSWAKKALLLMFAAALISCGNNQGDQTTSSETKAANAAQATNKAEIGAESTSSINYPTLTTDPLACGNKSSENLSWTSTGPLISPKGDHFSVKDPSIVYYNDNYHVFATINDGNWKSIYMSFANFDEAPSADYQMFSPANTGSSTVAPQVFYFTPQKKWYIFTQWAAQYTTNDNIENVDGWTERTFIPQGTKGAFEGNSLDFWVICDDAKCYLYYFKDDGKMYYMTSTIENFPNFDVDNFKVANVQNSGPTNIVFEAGNIYKIKGSDYYLLQVEGWGSTESKRLYRSWVSKSLDGPWIAHKTSEEKPFAGMNNTTFEGEAWSHQISHGEMIREGYDEKMVLDPCNMQFLYQGVDLKGFDGTYGERPYKVGLLKQND